MNRLTILERAFELAQSGDCENFNDLRQKLKAEGYTDSATQMSFPSLRKQLSAIIQCKKPTKAACA
jgi:exonuclease VII large subunit